MGLTPNEADRAKRRRLQQRVIRTVAMIALVVGAGLFVRRTFFPATRERAATSAPSDLQMPTTKAGATKQRGHGTTAAVATSAGLRYEPVDPLGTLRLEGRVIDANERPVPGIEVALSGFPRRTAITEDDGSFVFEGLIAQLYRLYARGEAGVAGPMSLQLTAASEPVTLVVHPGAELEFLVINTDKEPIAGAAISLSPLEDGRAAEQAFALTARTNAAGKALVRGLPFGIGQYRVTAKGYASELFEAYKAPRLRQQITVELVAADALHGVVLQASGTPAPNVCLTREEQAACETLSDNAGKFAIAAVAPGLLNEDGTPIIERSIVARHPDYGTGKSKPGDGDGTMAQPFRISLSPNRVVRGTVRDEHGEAVAGALVRTGDNMAQGLPKDSAAVPTGPSVFKGVYLPNRAVAIVATDAHGAFEITAPTTARPTLGIVATFGAQVSNVVDVDLTRDETPSVELHLIATASSEIGGLVLQPDGAPADGAQVSARYAGEDPNVQMSMLSVMGPPTTISNADGEFVIGGLLPGEYVVKAVDPAYTSEGKPNAKANARTGTSNVVLTLPQAGSVRVVAHAPDGLPITTTSVCVTTPVRKSPRKDFEPPPLAITCGKNLEGKLLLAGVPVGTHTFGVGVKGMKPATFTATIRHGETTDAGVVTLLPN